MTAYRTMPMIWPTDGMGGRNPCSCCGREMKGTNHYEVHVIEGGSLILHPDDEHIYTPDSGDMDWHLIGSTCAKKFKGFAKKVAR